MEAAIYATAGLLLVALVSGLSFLAIQFPKTFKTIYYATTLIGTLAIFCLVIYDIGASRGGNAVLAFVPPPKAEEAASARHAVQPAGWAYMSLAGLNLFLLILSYVSGRVEREKEEVERAKGDGK